MKKKNKSLPGNYLEYVPRHNDSIKYETDANGAVTILKENSGFFHMIARNLFKKPRISYIHLDEMGNFIWPLINGRRTVYDISMLVSEEFGQKAEPLYNRLIQYLINLETYGFIEIHSL
ncbi:MAG: PqqD family protein [Lachnospiraceae bacterium]|nr:PqqD family protein [Lachnospiraceae bacterium]